MEAFSGDAENYTFADRQAQAAQRGGKRRIQGEEDECELFFRDFLRKTKTGLE